MNQFTLRFTAQEVDQIANILAQRPFVEVHALLANIKQQVDQAQQIASLPQTAAPPEGT
jgi:hypothetical protein